MSTLQRQDDMRFQDLTCCVDESTRPWVDMYGIVGTQVLRVSADTGVWVIRNRFPAEFRAPTHLHTGEVHAFTIAGTWGYEEYDFVSTPGSYVHEQAGAVHTLVIGSEGAEIQFVVNGAYVNYNPDGTIIDVQDGRSVLRSYLEECAAQGLDVPEGILV